MHEFSLCKNLLEQIIQIARDQHARRITTVHVKLGPLSGVKAKQLQESFPLASRGSLAENAKLLIEDLPLKVHCRTCDNDSETLPEQPICRHCHSHDTQILSGDEMIISDIELIH